MNNTLILRLIAAYNFILGLILLFPLAMLSAVASMMVFSGPSDQQRYGVNPASTIAVVLLAVLMIAGIVFLDRGLLKLRARYRVIEIGACALQIIVLIGMLSKSYGHSIQAIVISAVFTVIPLSIIAWLTTPSVRNQFTSQS